MRWRYLALCALCACTTTTETQPPVVPTAPASLSLPTSAVHQPRAVSYPNGSIWAAGRRSLYRDQAHAVGDILTVKVDLTDEAQLESDYSIARDSEHAFRFGNFFGLGSLVDTIVSGTITDGLAIDLESEHSISADGELGRSDTIKTKIPARIVALNGQGHAEIEGWQKAFVDREERTVYVHGLINLTDLDAANEIDLSQVANSTLLYGGEGSISRVSRPPIGSEAVVRYFPF
ncbi:MAG: flagellar basal body L-ring protein FlgH [Geminicoccaceae bacterium]